MKKILLLLLLPFIGFGQISNFPWTHDFENFIELEQDTMNDFGDWWLNQGPTSSNGSGPVGNHRTGGGVYSYIDSSTPNDHNDKLIKYTPEYDVT